MKSRLESGLPLKQVFYLVMYGNDHVTITNLKSKEKSVAFLNPKSDFGLIFGAIPSKNM